MHSMERMATMPRYKNADQVKVRFTDSETGDSEWMWLKVDYCDETKGIVFGWLDSQLVVLNEKIRLDRRLAVSGKL